LGETIDGRVQFGREGNAAFFEQFDPRLMFGLLIPGDILDEQERRLYSRGNAWWR
jgi:hypothetical protein